MTEAVVVHIDGAVATLQLNRPESLNALNPDMILALTQSVVRVANNAAVRCVVLRGSGGHFMAGGDLGFFADRLAAMNETSELLDASVFERVNQIILGLTQMSKPVIASVEGAVAGFGLSLMLACDLVVAADNAQFTSAYRSIGATPDGGMSFHLPRLVGVKKAMELILIGDRFDAQQALQMGLVNRVVAADQLTSATDGWAQKLVDGPGQAIARSKQLLHQAWGRSLSEQLAEEAAVFRASTRTGDFAEGVRAFLDKRAPRFNQEDS